jgi:hypothetical protein
MIKMTDSTKIMIKDIDNTSVIEKDNRLMRMMDMGINNMMLAR